MPKLKLRLMSQLFPYPDDVERPRTRGDCEGGGRPCPFISCQYHLYVDVNPRNGAMKWVRPDIDPEELERMPDTCALDVADRGGTTLEDVGALMNFTRERTRQVEVGAIAKLKRNPEARALLAKIAEAVTDEPIDFDAPLPAVDSADVPVDFLDALEVAT